MPSALQSESDREVKGVISGELSNTHEPESDAERRLRRKLDVRLMPVVVVLALMNSIDTILHSLSPFQKGIAVSFGRLKGLQSDLHYRVILLSLMPVTQTIGTHMESDVQYNTVLAVSYALYFPALVPSNMVDHFSGGLSCRKAHNVVSFYTISRGERRWPLMEQVNPDSLETGYNLSGHFVPPIELELGLRAALLSTGVLMAIAFGSHSFVLRCCDLWAAAVLETMNGKLNVAAWRWLFFIEGIVTVTVGLLSMWLLPDYPRNTRWLNAEEGCPAQLRLVKDVGEADMDSEEASIFEGLLMVVKDAKVYLFMVMHFALSISTSFVAFFPTLIATLGYSTTVTFVMAAFVLFFCYHNGKCPECFDDSAPWILSVIVGVVNAWHSDRTSERFFHLIICWWTSIIGFIISLSTMETTARYFSQCSMTLSFSGNMLLTPWVVNAIPRPPGKRSATITLTNGFCECRISCWLVCLERGLEPTVPSFTAHMPLFPLSNNGLHLHKHMEHQEIDNLEKDECECIEKAAELEGITFDEGPSVIL
ncbi:hypothetical protein EDC04DRAFT_2608106 [Pisolithus marmoratus]|nr:hypothetical protein EDC04DRAFT_2608106 [Pisolithus marmoratus]